MCDGWLTDSGVGGDDGTLWSDSISWTALLVPVSVNQGAAQLDLSEGWQERWLVSWKAQKEVRSRTVRQVAEVPLAGTDPIRVFSWARSQRHRPGLQYMVSTGRHHGFESIEEARVLLALDFAGDIVDVMSQPVKFRFETTAGLREHIPDFLAVTRTGTWLIDVRPEQRIGDEDREAFAAAAEVALAFKWAYVVVARWRQHVVPAVDAISSQRRPLQDPLGLQPGLLAAAAEMPTFGEMAACSLYEPAARAQLLHLLWHRRLGVDLYCRAARAAPRADLACRPGRKAAGSDLEVPAGSSQVFHLVADGGNWSEPGAARGQRG